MWYESVVFVIQMVLRCGMYVVSFVVYFCMVCGVWCVDCIGDVCCRCDVSAIMVLCMFGVLLGCVYYEYCVCCSCVFMVHV